MGSLTLACCFPQINPNFALTITRNHYSIPIKPTNIKLINLRLQPCNCTTVLSSSKPNWVKGNNNEEEEDDEMGGFVVINFYRFVVIQEPELEVSKHLHFLQGRDIHGRIYINEQGINAQYSGPSEDAIAYANWIKKDERFKDILVQISPPIHKHAFPRLKLRYKPSLVQMEGGVSHLPLVDSSMRATPLTPSEWRKKLSNLNNKDVILLDVRNGYEWDIGHFNGAQRPNVDCFRSTTFGLSESEDNDSDPLAIVNKENTEILMYCTGGIRCDVYSTILRQKGYKNLYTLKGGISHYLEREGPVEWIGNLFVFDSRLSLPPSSVKHESTNDESIKHEVDNNKCNTVFAKCYICGSQVSELRHRNCANLDCNLLFLCCSSCMNELRGCCTLKCTSADRLRPVLQGHERYKKWHHYRDT
ncbi:rhodanese-like domain-containing protein 8, chloroplastic [Bidens hawaiensis]|uniref:rhodanese-like domain-containing protein 8, chloroplastic n=1 Tax=Bidens hawaiensis TaxID=980011 RepID=UPI00404918FE